MRHFLLRLHKRLQWLLPALFIVITASAHFILKQWGDVLPVEMTNILSLSLLPYLLSAPILKSFGMKTAESWAMPDFPGYLLVSAFCCLLLFGVGRVLQKFAQNRG